MLRTKLFAGFLLGATAFASTMASAGDDCGNPPVQSAELVHTIQTPEQVIQPIAEAAAPTYQQRESAIITSPTFTSSSPSATNIVQSADSGTLTESTAVSAYAAVLQRRITRGAADLNLFDYAGAKAAGELVTIKAYTDELASQNPDALSERDQIAYWANLYNALTVKLILEEYPIKSIRKIKAGAFSLGPWKRDEVTVNGKVLSLDDIEHKILRKRYADPAMVHYMVNCASIGCPNLQPKLWDGATLDANREAAAREFINSPRGVKIKGETLQASSIYDWFKDDFGGSKSATLDHYRKFAGPELRAALDSGAKIDGYDYNWDLNE